MLLERVPVRFRLSLIHAAWISVLFAVIGFGLFKVVEHTLLHSVDAALLSSAHSIRDLSKVKTHSLSALMIETVAHQSYLKMSSLAPERFIRPHAQIMNLESRHAGDVHVFDAKKIQLPLTQKTLLKAEKGVHSFETFTFKDKPPFRQLSLPLMKEGKFSGDLIQVGTTLGPTQSVLKGTAILLWLLLPLILLVSVIFGYVLMAQALKPVEQMSQAASNLGVHDLHIRLEVPPAEDELQELALAFNKMLNRLEDAITRLRRFTADVSHELRTPLAVLRGEAELALRRERGVEAYKSSLTSIHRESFHMSEIVENLLLLAKVESSNLALTWEKVDAEVFLKGLLESVDPVYAAREIRLESSLKGIKEFSCSRTYLFLALKNILLNASKHSSPLSKVDFDIWREADKVCFQIRDYGEGIEEKDLPYIFDPFYRSDTARNRANGGVGIGLSLTLALIKLHNGEIQVESQVVKGTTFIVSVPLHYDFA